MVQGSYGLEGFRSWGVVGSDENGGTSVEEGYKGFGGKTVEQCTIQSPGFKDPGYLDKVYKVVKAHYRLHQAPRAWYETLANYLLENGFQRGKIDQTLFIKKRKGNILLVQVYVDDIIFGSTNKELYVKSASTPIKTEKPFLKDRDGKDVDVHIYSEELASPKQTTLGKDYSNLFMAGSFPKTIWHFITAVSYKFMLFGLTKDATVNLILLEDVIRRDLRLDDADGFDCLPNEEIFAELTCMGYKKPPPKLTFYNVFFYAQRKFLIHTLVQYVSAKSTAWNEFSCSMESAVICLDTGRKFNFSKYIFESMVFANMRMVGNGFSRVETPLFALMLVQPLSQAVKEKEEVEVPTAPALPSPTNLEILKLKKRVKKLEKKKKLRSLGFKRLRKNGTSHRVESSADTVVDEDVAAIDAELQGRIDQDDEINATNKGVNTAKPTVFDDEEVTMTMAQTLIKIKDEKTKLLDEQIAQRLHYEEVEKAAAREKQERMIWKELKCYKNSMKIKRKILIGMLL
nr:putative ribonuclease H-like domain-containing protein [Tanacetum cinerariifolium]